MVRLRLAHAWCAIFWERAWDRFWPLVTLIAAGVAVALTDLLPSLPVLIHFGLLVVFALGACILAARGNDGFALPTHEQGRARLEAATPELHRPLTAAEDRLAAGASPLQRALWRRHQGHARRLLARLRAPWPVSTVARRDIFAIRIVPILILVIAAAGTEGDAGERLWRAIAPPLRDSGTVVSVKMWINPPAYTGRSPVFVELPSPAMTTDSPLEVLSGSKVLVVATGARHGMALVMKAGGRAPHITPLSSFTEEADASAKSSRLETLLSPMDKLEIQKGTRVLASWPVIWRADAPPRVRIAGTPQDTGGGRLRVDYVVGDDYGIAGMKARITRPGNAATGARASIDVDLGAPLRGTADKTQSALIDLAANPWAGLPVTLQLEVTDHSGQQATSGAVKTVLPERTFTNPVARELARLRKMLLTHPEHAIEPTMESISQMLARPDAYRGDHIVYLALSSGFYRLNYQAPLAAAPSLALLLWHTAVRIEDGNRGTAEARMIAAERDLQNALARNAPSAEINQLVNRLEQALAEYTQALLERMPTTEFEFDLGALDEKGSIIGPDDIIQMLERMRQLAQLGARDAAKQLLTRVQSMLQSLRNAAAGSGQAADLKAAEQLLRELRELTRAQSTLLDESFKRARREPIRGAREAMAGAQSATGRQEGLMQQLDGLTERLTEMAGHEPDDLRAARESMREAANELRASAWRAGADAQAVALAKLEAGMQQATQQILLSLAEKGLSGIVRTGGMSRSRSGIPSESEDALEVPRDPDADGLAQRARAILEELRRRASERDRPTEEQDYLRRLMRAF